MAAIQRSTRAMRIIALPLTRPHPPQHINGTLKSNPVLTYYHFQLTLPSKPGADGKPAQEKTTYVKWATRKAADVWASFGKADEGSWKLKIYRYGERLVDRIDFEELALKSVDPSIAPSLGRFDFSESVDSEKEEKAALDPIPLLYPPSIVASNSPNPYSPLQHLRELLSHRTPRHRKGFFMWMMIAPLTAPFMLIPVIPNLPFFFCVWRSWSHWRAYRASQYLESLADNGAIAPKASKDLDKVYAEHRPGVSASSPSSSTPPDSEASETSSNAQGPLLTRNAVPAILMTLSLPSSAGADMYRAIEQVRMRVSST